MSEFLFRYETLEPTTWAYLSALLIIALFFKFNRIFSIRNLDLLLLLMLAPGLLGIRLGIEYDSPTAELFGYWWLFGVNTVLLFRALWDSAMVRRPLLDPNMNASGLLFLAVSLFLFLMANVIASNPDANDMLSAQRAHSLSHRQASTLEQISLETHGPGFPLLFTLPEISTARMLGARGDMPADVDDDEKNEQPEAEVAAPANDEATAEETPPAVDFTTGQLVTAKVVAIISQAMIFLGMVLIGARHFENFTMGCAAAMLYLLLPYTAMWTGSVTHLLPAALIVWAVFNYRLPMLAGVLLGLAFGTVYYPVFLFPLWISFYWRRGVVRFAIGIGIALAALVITQIATSSDFAMFASRMQQMFGIHWPQSENLTGAWHYWNPVFRWPILATFLGMSLLTFPLWPQPKTLASLLSCSAAVMLGVQFWHAHSDGLALAWYLPLFLLMVFRPNLEDRVAVNVVR
ncbi:hypothetical protein [Aeoliella sp. SH292]|uniref:hypothetical protein n=1 Tax=Aeoliella sp. SH292 TaxID=3454464 RepID=UPI003F9AB190